MLHANRGYSEDLRVLAKIVKRLSELSDPKLNDDLSDFVRKLEGGQPPSALLQVCYNLNTSTKWANTNEHEFLGLSHGAEQLHHCVWTWLATRRVGS